MVKRSPNATLTSKVAIDQATAALQDLPDKPKENVSLREAVDLLQDDIIAALNKGYSYEEMTEVLSKQGISIAPSSLKHYLARSKRQASTKTTPTKRKPRSTGAKSKADDADDDQLVEESESTPSVEMEMEEMEMEEMEMEPAAEPSQPRRTKSTAATKSAASKTTSRGTSRAQSAATATRKRRGKTSS